MRLVVFSKHYGIWNSGEVAGFPDAEAADLVHRKIARFPESPAAGRPSPEEPPAAEPAGEAGDRQPGTGDLPANGKKAKSK